MDPSRLSSYTIQLAEPHHIPALQAVERAAASIIPSKYLPEAIRGDTVEPELHLQGQKAGTLWVALERQGNPVGFLLLLELDGDAFIREVDVHPDFGRRGIGTALIHTAEAWAREQGYTGMVLTTYRDIPWNAPFYAKLGFEIVAPIAFTPAMSRQFEEEARWGLNLSLRVFMCKRLMV
ncbi:MAG: GCN5 family N-acetyltransferase [Candidatus Hydrogenedentota bacterium]